VSKHLEGKVVGVEWEDAHYNTDEVEAHETVHRPWIYTSVGVLVKSDDVGVTLSMDQGEDGKFRGRTFILRKLIVREWEIGPVKPKQRRKKKKTPEPPSLSLPFTPHV